MKRLIDTALIGAQRAAALQNQCDTATAGRPRDRRITMAGRMIVQRFCVHARIIPENTEVSDMRLRLIAHSGGSGRHAMLVPPPFFAELSPMSFKGKVALVTGSTSGIGLAIARAFAQGGADVCINGFGDAAAIEKERSGIETDFGVKAIYSGADMSKGAECEAMIADTIKQFGSVDILVNNAGIQFVSPIEDFPPEKWDQIIAINLSSAFHTTRAAVPGMKAKKWGRVINTASAHALVASPFKSAYVSAKHGIAGLTKTVAL